RWSPVLPRIAHAIRGTGGECEAWVTELQEPVVPARSEDAMDELWYQPARVLADRLRSREVSAVEVLAAHLARVEKYNPSLNAVVSLDVDRAREAAVDADRALARDEHPPPLLGVPMELKDGHDVAGLRTTAGTEIFDRIPEHDGTVAARLRAAGAII